MNEIKWTIRVDQLHPTQFHWVVVRVTTDSKYQKDGDEDSQSLAMAAAIAEVSKYEELNREKT